jgi:putative hydrolase of the HAD superfamily
VIGTASEEEALTEAFKKLEITEDWRKWHKTILKWYTPRKKLINYAKELRKNIKICMLSDQTQYIIELEEKYRFFKNFDLSIISTQVGVAKPNSKIFNLALHLLEIKPNEVVFVDDNPVNVNAAKKMGIHAFLVGDFERNNFQEFKKLNNSL